MVTALRIGLLGDFKLSHGETPLASIHSGRLQLLIAYLILHRDAPCLRGHIAYQFWPDSTEAQARTNLRQLVFHLRKALPDPDRFLDMDARVIRWREDAPCQIDLLDFERAIGRARGTNDTGEELTELEEAVALYRGDLLNGYYDEWVLADRYRLRDQYTGALLRLVQLYEDSGDIPAAIRHGEKVLRQDPLHEARYRTLMRLHGLNGDRASALRVYQDCAETLMRELGVEPEEATRTAYARIQQSEAPPSVEAQNLTPASAPPLFGRDDEWRQLLTAGSSALSGRSGMALITGEAGIGKTRIAEELLLWAIRQGIATARARSYQAEGRLAYGPVTDWLRGPQVYPALSRLAPVWRTEVARLLPELLAEDPDLPRPEPIQEGWQRQHLFAALARATVGAVQPLLLLVDDLQWSDQDTFEWLHYLLRFDSGAKLLILATVRTGAMSARDDLQALILDLRREDLLTELALGPLDPEATARLARHLTGQEIDADAAGRLYRNTEGNPLFIVETLREGGATWMEAGETTTNATVLNIPAGASVSLPPRAHAVISARLAQLTPTAQDLAGLAATIGRAFTSVAVVKASEADEEKVTDALDELWRRQIIRDQADGRFYFSHEKIREVAYAGISPARRALLHRRVARTLKDMYRDDLDSISGQLAAHYERAGMLDESARYYLRAAELAQQVYAHSEAISLLQRGVDALMRLPESRARDAREFELLTALGSSLYAQRGFGSQEGLDYFGAEFDEVYSRTQQLSQRLGIPVNPRVLRAMAIVFIARGQVRAALGFGAELLKIAQDASDNAVLRAILHTEAHYVIGAASHWLGRLTIARSHFEAAIGYYDRRQHRIHAVQYGQDPGVLCRSRLAYTLLQLGYPDQSLHWSRDALALARELAYPNSLAYALSWASWVWAELGDLEGALALTTEVLEMAEDQQFGIWRHSGNAVLGWMEVQQGAGLGISHIQQGIDGNYGGAQLLHVPYMLTLLADAYRHLEHPTEGLATVAEGLSVVEETGIHFIEAELHRLRGELLRQQGATAEAEAAFQQALSTARDQEARLLELRAATSCARLLLDQGRLDNGRRALQPVYSWFTEGFDTPDLVAARELLVELGG